MHEVDYRLRRRDMLAAEPAAGFEGVAQRDRVRQLARERSSTMTDALDAALLALGREQFFRSMADAEAGLRADPEPWADDCVRRPAHVHSENISESH